MGSKEAINDTELQVRDINCLRHMLGVGERMPKSRWGYRNRYCTVPVGDDFVSMKKLESLGYVEQGREQTSLIYFHATRAGCELVGLGKRQILNALGE